MVGFPRTPRRGDRFTVCPELGSLDDLPVPRPGVGGVNAWPGWAHAGPPPCGDRPVPTPGGRLCGWLPVWPRQLLRVGGLAEDLHAVREWLPEAVEWLAPGRGDRSIDPDADTTSVPIVRTGVRFRL